MQASTRNVRTAEQVREALRHGELHKTAFAMGCFWGPDSRFGAMSGVVQTRVGYGGGRQPDPDYRSVGDHAETVRVIFDPSAIAFDTLLEEFRTWHTPSRGGGQYRAAIFPSDDAQRASVQAYLDALPDPSFALQVSLPGTEEALFWDAEAYHQKHRLRASPAVVAALEAEFGPRWDESSVATKLNGVEGKELRPDAWLACLSERAQAAYHTARAQV